MPFSAFGTTPPLSQHPSKGGELFPSFGGVGVVNPKLQFAPVFSIAESIRSTPLKITEKFTSQPQSFLQEDKSMENEIQDNVVDMLRERRNRYYEATKHMTREEKWEYDQRKYEKAKAEFEKRTANLKPDYDRFPFLRGK